MKALLIVFWAHFNGCQTIVCLEEIGGVGRLRNLSSYL